MEGSAGVMNVHGTSRPSSRKESLADAEHKGVSEQCFYLAFHPYAWGHIPRNELTILGESGDLTW